MTMQLDAGRPDAGPAQVIRFQPRPAPGFTSPDLIELSNWGGPGQRVEIDQAGEPLGQFAMLFRGGAPWASWAISREGAMILAWDCVSLADIGRFETMRAALQALPGAEVPALRSRTLAQRWAACPDSLQG